MNTKLLSQSIKLIIALYLADIVSKMVLEGNYIVMIALVAAFIFFFKLSWENKYFVLSAAVFYPLMFKGRFAIISNPAWIEIVGPALCLTFLVKLIFNKEELFSKRAFIFFAAAAVLLLWAMINYIKNPVLGQTSMGVGTKQGGIRSYFSIFIGITVFLFSYWYARYEKLNMDRWLTLLVIVSFILGITRIISYFFNFYVPFLGEGFKHGTISWSKGEEIRILGLGHTSAIGITGLLALNYMKKWRLFHIALLIGFIIIIVLSGARALFFGTTMSVLVYISLVNRKYFFPFLSGMLIVVGIFTLFFSDISLSESKYGRVAGLSEKHIKREIYRFETFKHYLGIFTENPVFGKGIGYRKVETEEDITEKFVTKQMKIGGHGAYLSILMVFGIGGFFFLTIMLFGSMYYSFRIIKTNRFDEDAVKSAVFVLLILIVTSMHFISSGRGYDAMKLWFIGGMISGILSRKGHYDSRLINV